MPDSFEPTTDQIAALIDYVGATPGVDDTRAADCYGEAHELVTEYIGTAVVPARVLASSILEVGSKLWQRRNSPNGAQQFTDSGMTPVFAPRDPMVTVYATLNRFVGGGFA